MKGFMISLEFDYCNRIWFEKVTITGLEIAILGFFFGNVIPFESIFKCAKTKEVR